ncbi:MAG: hypothetical protein MJ176_03220 [Treponema sp.]|nr:hypothetical protein [Treponema sp.]
MRIGFRFFNTESIEKSKKGVRRSSHKYIRVFTGNNGKDEYIYPEDMKNPFKKLLSIFAITKEKISSVFKKERIEENYGVDENTFAAHVLEYLTDKAKWDKFFSNPTVAHKNKKPVNLNKKKPGVKTEDKKVAEKKETEKKMTVNRSLMRKIWGIFNPAKEEDSEAMFNSGNTESVIPAEEKIKDFVGRKTSIDKKSGITTMKWPDGREIKTDAKGNVIYDSTNIGPVEEVATPETNIVSNEPSDRMKYLTLGAEIKKLEQDLIEAGNSEREIEINEELMAKEKEFKRLENKLREEESLEATKNRSDAMLGNDNAKKDIHSEELKDEFNSLIKRYTELDKEFKSNGGYSYKRTTKEQDEKRRAASKEKSEVEEKLRELKAKISEENKGKMTIPAAYKDVTNAWLKRLAKGDSISWEWLDKKFGGHYGEILSFGDDFYIDLSETTITNPVVRIKYDESGSERYVSVDVGEMNKDQYRPRFMNMWDSNTFSKVYATFESLKEKINNTEGNTPAEKFFNMVLGSDNEISKKADNSIVPTYRFTKDGIKNKDGKLEKIRARINNEGTPDEIIDLMADGYSDHIPSIFFPKNDTDAMTDYFDKDSAYVKPDHPYYNHLKVMALKNRLYRGRATKWGAMSKEDQDKLEKQIKDLEKTLTEPTDEELKAYRERRNHEEEVKEKWEEGEKAARRKEQEENERKKEVEATNKFIANLEKLAEMWRKDPPVILDGMTKEQAIETMEDRIFKVKMEIKNSDDPETIASNTKFLEQLQQKLEAIRESPESEWATEEIPEEPETPIRSSTEVANELADVRRQMFTAEDEELERLKTRYAALNEELKEATAREISAEEHQNRSNAMLGNQNAYKGGPGEETARAIISNPNSVEKQNYDSAEEFLRTNNRTDEEFLDVAERRLKMNDNGFSLRIAENILSKDPENVRAKKIYDQSIAKLNNYDPVTLTRKDVDLPETPVETTPTVEETPAVETVETEDDITTPIPTINPDVARRVSDNSMSGHAGDVYQHDVNAEMQNFREMFDVSTMNEQQKEYFQERLNAFAALVGSSFNEMASKRLAAGPSWVVAGPAKYNFKRFEQKMNAEMRVYDEFKEKKEKFIRNTQKRLKELKYTGGAESEEEVKARVFEDYANGNYSYNDKVDSTDPYAIEKISGKIKFMENAHDVTLMYRKQCKKAKISTMDWNDSPEDVEKRKEVNREVIKLAQEKGYSIGQIKQGLNHPFPQNQTQEIARNKQRLEELQKRKEAIEKLAAKETESGGNAGTVGRVDFDGGYVYENLEMDRIQIIYDGKPDKDTISTLKHNGFHWTPSQGAWQRQLNRNGRMAVNRVFAETGIDKKIDIDGAGEVKKSDVKEDEMFIKAFEFCDFYLGRSYNVGDLRTWKGKVFKLSKSGTWERFTKKKST